MFLNFQTRSDIRAEIIQTFEELKRAATSAEIFIAIWCRCAIDGTRRGVRDIVVAECAKMVNDGALEVERAQDCNIDGYQMKVYFLKPDLLTRLSLIKSD